MEIYTSSYKYCDSNLGISVSGDAGKNADFNGKVMRSLAPKKSWWQIWHDNIGKLPEEENLIFYINAYYETVLSQLNVADILHELIDGSILLCYEEPESFCHRHIIAAWLELYYAQEVPEIKLVDGKKIQEKRNKYFPIIKGTLETLIKRDIEMYGYSSIAAAHLHEASLKVDEHPHLYEQFGVKGDMYRRLAQVIDEDYKTNKKTY